MESFITPGSQAPITYDHELRNDLKLRIDFESVLLVVLLVLFFSIRLTNIDYNTLFVDEAIYVLVGQHVIDGAPIPNVTSWMYGSYVYPLIAATVDNFLGVAGIRGLSALLSAIAALCVFRATDLLLNRQAALWTTLIFGMTAVSINLGQFAVYDAPAVTLLSIAFYCLARAALGVGYQELTYLLLATASVVGAVLAKYLAVLYFPALLLVAVACYLAQRRSISSLFSAFFFPTILILGLYVLFYRHDLAILFTGDFGVQTSTRWSIAQDIWLELDVVLIAMLLGLGWLAWEAYVTTEQRTRRGVVVWTVLAILLVCAFCAGPLYHLFFLNRQSAWKHTLFSLIFLSPLAGYALAMIIAAVQAYRGRWKVILHITSIGVSLLAVTWFLNFSLERNRHFQQTWPNVSEVVRYLEQQDLTSTRRVLAEGSYIYAYYFNFGSENRAVWQDTWFMDYAGKQGWEAMSAAVQDSQFDFVILDDYYTPGLRDYLEPFLFAAGYAVDYTETQFLSSGEEILVTVYTPDHGINE